jgi:hypothetical protein
MVNAADGASVLSFDSYSEFVGSPNTVLVPLELGDVHATPIAAIERCRRCS